MLKGHTGSVRSVTFSLDRQLLASGSDDKTIRLWELETGKELRYFAGRLRGGVYMSVAFSPDGQILAGGSDDGTVLLWDATIAK